MKWFIAVTVALATFGLGRAYAEAPWATTAPLEQAAKAPNLEVRNGDDVTWGTVSFPAVPAQLGKVMVLRLQIRGASDTPGGCNYNTTLKLNDRIVEPKTRAGAPRLINHSEKMLFGKNGIVNSNPGMIGNALMVFYGPPTELDSRSQWQRDEMYWYVFDVTDMVKADGENKLSFSNAATLKITDGRPLSIVFEDIAVGYMDPAVVKARLASYDKK